MRLLLILTLILFGMIALPLTTIMVLSRAGANPASQTRLEQAGVGLCAGKPCYKGMIPGETDWNDLDSLLQYDDASTPLNVARRRSRAGVVEIYRGVPDFQPDQVTLIVAQVNVPLWEVLQVFGKPCSVRITTRTGETFSRYRLLYPFVEVFGNPREKEVRALTELDPNLRVDTVLIRGKMHANESDRGSCRPTTDDWFELFGSWRGFASLEAYRRNAGH